MSLLMFQGSFSPMKESSHYLTPLCIHVGYAIVGLTKHKYLMPWKWSFECSKSCKHIAHDGVIDRWSKSYGQYHRHCDHITL